jgi:hypothetical protein
MRKVAMGMQRQLFCVIGGLVLLTGPVLAQIPPQIEAKLRRTLPPQAGEELIRQLDLARQRGLPLAALEQRALELSLKGLPAEVIVRAVAVSAGRLDSARTALSQAREAKATAEEIDAGAVALGKGLSDSALSDFARSAPTGRSLAVPLLVVASLVDQGVSVDGAVGRVLNGLSGWRSDEELVALALPASEPPYSITAGQVVAAPSVSPRPLVKRGPHLLTGKPF